MKNSADLGGCYPQRPSASVDNTLLDLQNSSSPTHPHSIIVKYARIFVRWHYLFREANSFPRAYVRFEEQIMSKDKCPSIFSHQMEANVFIILQIFFATLAVLKIESFNWGIFVHMTCLNQSPANKNIWWIINMDLGLLQLLQLIQFRYPMWGSHRKHNNNNNNNNNNAVFTVKQKWSRTSKLMHIPVYSPYINALQTPLIDYVVFSVKRCCGKARSRI